MHALFELSEPVLDVSFAFDAVYEFDYLLLPLDNLHNTNNLLAARRFFRLRLCFYKLHHGNSIEKLASKVLLHSLRI